MALRPAPEAPSKAGCAARYKAGDENPDDQIDNARHTPVHSDLGLLLLEREERLERSDQPLRDAMEKGRYRVVQIGLEDHQNDAEDDRAYNKARDNQDDPSEQAHRSDLYLEEARPNRSRRRAFCG